MTLSIIHGEVTHASYSTYGEVYCGQVPLCDVRPSVWVLGRSSGSRTSLWFERVIWVDLSYEWLTGKWRLRSAIKMMKLWVWKVRGGVTGEAKHDGNRGHSAQGPLIRSFSSISWPADFWSFTSWEGLMFNLSMSGLHFNVLMSFQVKEHHRWHEVWVFIEFWGFYY